MKFIQLKNDKIQSIIEIKNWLFKKIKLKEQLIRFSLILLLTSLGILPVIAAEIKIADKKTALFEGENSVPVINIATPDADGVSHNIYHQFNVGEQGVVLNNHIALQTAETLAGNIEKNPNLQNNAAAIIINEVVSSNTSELNGMLQVAGQEANVIIANPYGIICNGCGFINTPNVSLVAGTTEFDNEGHLSGFDMRNPHAVEARWDRASLATLVRLADNHKKNKENNAEEQTIANQLLLVTKKVLETGKLNKQKLPNGNITIVGGGLTVPEATDLKLFARTLNIETPLTAKNLTLIAGVNQINANDSKVTQTDPRPELAMAIDVSALGGLSAGSITLISTGQGVGVNLNNLAASTGEIELNTAGNLMVNNAQANHNIRLSSRTQGAEINLSNMKSSTGSVRFYTKGKITVNNADAYDSLSFNGDKLQLMGNYSAGYKINLTSNDIRMDNTTLMAVDDLYILTDKVIIDKGSTLKANKLNIIGVVAGPDGLCWAKRVVLTDSTLHANKINIYSDELDNKGEIVGKNISLEIRNTE